MKNQEISNLQKMLIMKLELTLESIDKIYYKYNKEFFSRFNEKEPRKFTNFKRYFKIYFNWKKLYSNITVPFHWFSLQSWIQREITLWWYNSSKYTFSKKPITDIWIFRVFVYTIEKFIVTSMIEYFKENKNVVVFTDTYNYMLQWIKLANLEWIDNWWDHNIEYERYLWKWKRIQNLYIRSIDWIIEMFDRMWSVEDLKNQYIKDYKILITYLRLLPKYLPNKSNYRRKNIHNKIDELLNYLNEKLWIK